MAKQSDIDGLINTKYKRQPATRTNNLSCTSRRTTQMPAFLDTLSLRLMHTRYMDRHRWSVAAYDIVLLILILSICFTDCTNDSLQYYLHCCCIVLYYSCTCRYCCTQYSYELRCSLLHTTQHTSRETRRSTIHTSSLLHTPPSSYLLPLTKPNPYLLPYPALLRLEARWNTCVQAHSSRAAHSRPRF